MAAPEAYFNAPRPFVGTPASPLRERQVHSQLMEPGLAQASCDVGNMGLFGGNLRARVFFEHDIAVGDRRQEVAVLGESFLLVRESLAQNLIDVVLVRFQQRADLQGRVTCEIGDVLAGFDRVRLGLVRLGEQPGDDRDAVVAEDQ